MTAAVVGPCDRGIAEAASGGAPAQAGAWTLAVCILASSLAFIDGSVVNVALASIGDELGAQGAQGSAGLRWVVNAYLLPLGALLLLGGAAGDRYGRRRLLLAGIALFALASALCAVAPTLPWLLAGRALQGVGAAMLMPNSLAVLGAAFTGEARGRAIGTWASVGAISGAVGPVLGGWLVDLAGWRWVFLINLPVAAAAIWLGRRHVTETVNGHGPPLDWLGAALAAAGLAALTVGLTELEQGAGGLVLPAIGVGAALLAAFVLVEARRGPRAMMPLALFGTRESVGLTLLTFLLYGALGGLLVALPFTLIEAGGYTALAAGAALLPAPALIGLVSRRMGRLAGRIGPRLPLSVGPLVAACGYGLLALADPAAPYWQGVLPALVVIALGMAGAVAPLTTAVMASVDAEHVGTASGFNSAIARIGGLVATALLGGVLAAQGAALVQAFGVACWIGAGLALAAAVAGYVSLRAVR